MDTQDVEQPEAVVEEESKPKGKWWIGGIAGGVVAFIAVFLFSLFDGYVDIGLLLFGFTFGFALGSVGGFIAQDRGISASLLLGIVFGILALFCMILRGPVLAWVYLVVWGG